ncbi:MAG: acetyl-CoA carboxylase biotin carboxyl carrier protein [Elusimicrobia bacterium]|nr:acetyl-CoA carboxylase biotin carboxyl carrier protein [Candidatus Liberimonas magnetica]
MNEIDPKKKKIASIKERVGELYDLMKNENLEELEIKDQDTYINLKRKGKRLFSEPLIYANPQVERNVVQSADTRHAEVKGETIKSPIIGTFYRSPSPTSAPFVKDGDTADEGKTLCIIEAMKVMNEIKAESRIKILKILVENGKPVTSGQDLFLIEK